MSDKQTHPRSQVRAEHVFIFWPMQYEVAEANRTGNTFVHVSPAKKIWETHIIKMEIGEALPQKPGPCQWRCLPGAKMVWLFPLPPSPTPSSPFSSSPRTRWCLPSAAACGAALTPEAAAPLLRASPRVGRQAGRVGKRHFPALPCDSSKHSVCWAN